MPEENKSGLNGGGVEHSPGAAASLQSQGKESLNADAVDEKGVSWKNRAMEYQGKLETVSSKLETTQSEIAELREQGRLNSEQLAKLSRLENKESNLEDQIAQLRKMPEAKPYLTELDRVAEKAKLEAKQEARREIQVELQTDWLEETASVEGVEYKDFVKGLSAFADKYPEDKFTPLQRAKKSFKDWKDAKKLDEDRKELSGYREKEKSFSEGNGRGAREQSKEETLKSGSVLDKIRVLGKYEPAKS